MNPLDLVKLSPLMKLTSGRPEIIVGLIDGPVSLGHPDLLAENIRVIPGLEARCSEASSPACQHGTFVAGILSARRGSPAPAICPDCTLLVRPIFFDTKESSLQMPSATPEELAEAIIDCVEAGAKVLNMSVALSESSLKGERRLEEALNYAAQRGVIPVAAAGNQGVVGSSALTRHSWVVPVAACDLQGRPLNYSNLGRSIGRCGLSAPGAHITSLGLVEHAISFSGTSAAAPFVTGTIALMWSEFSTASAVEMKLAVSRVYGGQRANIFPPLLDAWDAYKCMLRSRNSLKESDK